MTRRSVDRQADILSRRLERASVVLPEIREHLEEQRRHVRTIGTPSNEQGRQVGSHSNPTERAALERDHCTYLEGRVDDRLAMIEIQLNLLDEDCRDILGYRRSDDDDPKPRCIGDTTAEGADCWSIPAPRRTPAGTKVDDGRCITCGFRYDAKQRAASDARRMRRHMAALGET